MSRWTEIEGHHRIPRYQIALFSYFWHFISTRARQRAGRPNQKIFDPGFKMYENIIYIRVHSESRPKTRIFKFLTRKPARNPKTWARKPGSLPSPDFNSLARNGNFQFTSGFSRSF